MNVLQTIFDGLALGALYALVAVGLALVFGVMRLINFAQGELITAGAYSSASGWRCCRMSSSGVCATSIPPRPWWPRLRWR
jgi:branched-subunit amino acid ABC-type transport system permease component